MPYNKQLINLLTLTALPLRQDLGLILYRKDLALG